MRSANGFAFCRAGLLGNPSDGYDGKAIAVSLANFRASVTIESSTDVRFVPGPSDLQQFASYGDAVARLASDGCDDGLRLMRAAFVRFAGHPSAAIDLPIRDPRACFAMRYETNIPRQVGLAGSSAIVVATLRALMSWFDVEIAAAEVADLALAAELEDLGIACGPMDRVIQAIEGLVVMDLREPRTEASYQSLELGLLPPMFLAWDPLIGTSSGQAHAELRSRWLARDPEILRTVEKFRTLVDEGVASLQAGAHDAFREQMNRNFDLRTTIFPVASRDQRLVAIARAGGGAAKQCGSGGAVIGVPGPDRPVLDLERAYRDAGFEFAEARFQHRSA